MTSFPTPYQDFIYLRTYSRWRDDLQRRETWEETVSRYRDFFLPRVPEHLRDEFMDAVNYIRSLDVMPSMRALWTAGEALSLENISGYNCAYTVIDSPKALAEVLYILMCGTGVGFSTEEKYVEKLPEVPKELSSACSHTIVVEDSRLGWAEAFLELLEYLWSGRIPGYDLSKIRPKGSRLKTFGGRASGPEPLKDLFDFTIQTFLNARGRKLTTLEVYDIVVTIAACVIAGGVRRSATINLSDLDDELMQKAKDGAFWEHHPNRSYSNNSAVYEKKPSPEEFMKEWLSLAMSGSGERGIVNREGLQATVKQIGRREWEINFGVNPCGEIILRPKQFCNLSEVIVRPEDGPLILIRKVKLATILGILQSTLTDFNFLSPEWKKNTEEERLLGVSLTGLRDHPRLSKTSSLAATTLHVLKQEAINTAAEWSKALGIPMPAAITCVKPSGTVSQLVDSSSGLHARYAPYYIRRVRVAAADPVATLYKDAGVPCHPEVGETWDNVKTIVFEFPCKAPEGSVTRDEESAIEQLEYWKMLKIFWTEHNPSNTIYVKDHEWAEVGAWVYKNFDIACGLSFLPYDGGVYQLAPYEEITEEEYKKLVEAMPEVDISKLPQYELEDFTGGSREFACVGDKCEI